MDVEIRRNSTQSRLAITTLTFCLTKPKSIKVHELEEIDWQLSWPRFLKQFDRYYKITISFSFDDLLSSLINRNNIYF